MASPARSSWKAVGPAWSSAAAPACCCGPRSAERPRDGHVLESPSVRGRLRVLHAIHDFLPRHRAGSEIYAFELGRALQNRSHHVSVVAAEYDPTRRHGTLHWREHEGLPVIEMVNNWAFGSFAES